MGFPSSCELAESRWSVVAACPIPWQFQSSLLRAAKNTNRDYVNRIRSSRYKMPATIYYDNDADLSLLKDKTIAILGYGSQGHAQAQNLRDSGCNVIVGQRPGSPNYDLAVSHGFEPMPIDEATKRGDLINILLPDEVQGDIFKDHILKNLSEGDILMCSHGFNLHFGQVEAPPGVDTLLVAPKGPGHLVRSEFEKGGGVPSLIAVGKGASEETKQLGLAYAKGIGGTRGGVIETTIAEETETDLFGEQVVLCGGVSELVKAAFETLVDAGYQPEMAYFECLHELKLIVDLFYQGGLSYMRYSVSNTAEYGDYSRGPRIINDDTRAEMKKILEEIQTGKFAREWILENRAGAPAFKAIRRRDRSLQIEDVGRRLRSLMSWIDSKEV
ncbi:MAG TPA: ketol-acid reductoisomerase [Pirellulaceae bacterium]|nr:ketol-acid reductoisomerase [Pirellulaceae bacterium]